MENVLRVNIDYNPLPSQEKFHCSEARFKLFCGGYGAGKTLALCHEILKYVQLYPGSFGLLARKTYDELQNTTLRVFLDIAQPLIRYHDKLNRHIYFWNGSELIYRSLDDPYKFRSLELSYVGIDEASETTEEMFLTLSARLRHKIGPHRLILVSNPVNVTHWIYEYFVKRNDPDYFYVKASTYENKDNLPPNYIESLEATYPPSWVNKYLKGNWGFTSEGQPVYSAFREDIHVRDLRYIQGAEMYVGIDFGFRNSAVVYTQLDEEDRWLIVGELTPRVCCAWELAKMMLDFQNKRFPRVTRFFYWGDPACRQRSDKSKRTTQEIMSEYGINVSTKPHSVASRIEIIQKRLMMKIGKEPATVIDRSCKMLIDALSGGYHYKKNTEEPEKDGLYDHIADALGYVAVGLFSHRNAEVIIRDVMPRKIGNLYFRR